MNEFKLIEKYLTPLTNKVGRGLKDDAAVFKSENNIDYVISTDTLVEKVHFFGKESPEIIAKKSLRTNISDLSAMGAEPLYYNLSLSVPKNKINTFIMPFAKGLKSDQETFNLKLIGGDLTSALDVITITITIFGKVPSGNAIPRSGAKNNDLLFVTGDLGLSNIGLRYFNSKDKKFNLAKDKYLIPEPRIVFSYKIRDYVNSMIDISDGLIQDAFHISKSSNLEIHLDISNIPTPLIKGLPKKEILNSALYGGDDYELLFSANKNNKEKIFKVAKKLNIKISEIGVLKKGIPGKIYYNKKEILPRGFQHF